MGGEGVVSRLRRVARKIGLPCIFTFRDAGPSSITISSPAKEQEEQIAEMNKEKQDSMILADKSICAICLEPLAETNPGSGDGKKKGGDGDETTVFRAECSHCFHCSCIASNIRHGNTTCPVCRSPWPQLPRSLKLPPVFQASDPVLRILDESIATSRLIRRSSLRASRYDDDDPVDAAIVTEHAHPSLQFSLVPSPVSSLRRLYQLTSSSLSSLHPNAPGDHQRVYLRVKLSPQQPVDVVLVIKPNGPHMRLLKQASALVVFALRPPDRLAIVTYASSANRAFPLRRMTSRGKQTALQVIDRLPYVASTGSDEGIQKGAKILEDRMHRNPGALILQLSDSPIHSLAVEDLGSCVSVHKVHVGLEFGTAGGLAMHDFEEFLMRLLGGVIENVRLRIGNSERVVRLGELKGGEERQIPLDMRVDSRFVALAYSYTEGGGVAPPRTGEAVASFEEKAGRNQPEEREKDLRVRGRRSCAERWDHLDPFLVRRRLKHLNSYKA